MKKWVALTVIGLAVMVSSRLAELPEAAGAFKLVASTGFILVALSAGATNSAYGRIIFAGLVFSWAGDAFLIGDGNLYFQLGLVSFLIAHLLYCGAFILHGVSLKWVAAAVLPLGLFAAIVARWLMPHVGDDMRIPVWAYIVVITTMVLLSVGAWGKGGPVSIPVGALLFYFSDISVAMGQFMETTFPHFVWGLPFYYVGQLFLAKSIADVNARPEADSGPLDEQSLERA